MNTEQSYRASIWAIIVDDDFNFLFVKLAIEKGERYDFVKWWMKKWETELETLKREIKEELWKGFVYEIIWKSSWYFIYDWWKEFQEKKWFRWQARQNYWVKCVSWEINLQREELSDYKWVSKENIVAELKNSNFSEIEINRFLTDFENIFKKSITSL